MKDIEVKEVIVSTLVRRGNGVVGDPIRRVTQVFEKTGELIAEHDSHLEERMKEPELKGSVDRQLQHAFSHEIQVALRYLSTRSRVFPDEKLPIRKEVVELEEMNSIFEMVKEAKFINWIEEEYNPNVQELARIRTDR